MVAYGTVRSGDPIGATTIIGGARAPLDADGAPGDYWLDSVGHVLYGPKAAVAPRINVYATDPAVVPGTSGPGNFTLGLRLQFLVIGVVSALRFYRPATSTATSRALTLYRVTTSVATATTSGESGSGWQTVPLTTPISVDIGVDYVVAYNTVSSTYSEKAGANPASYSPTRITNVGSQYISGEGYPNTNQATNYMVDLVFNPDAKWPVAIKSAS